jgi:DNA-3-methyladenine glycosylase
MAKLRGLAGTAKPKLLTSGPGRLCQALGITRAGQNGLDVTASDSELQFLDDGFRPGRIVATPRIGIRKAVERPHRFFIAGNEFVSGEKAVS